MRRSEGKAAVLLSDVHLNCFDSSVVNTRFLDFLHGLQPARVSSLYILGDLFDVWLGDDTQTPFVEQIQQTLAQLNQRGIMVFIQHGNRDFMLGMKFARRCCAILLPEAYVLEAGDGKRWLLMHGDSLVDEAAYLRYRRFIRHPLILAPAKLAPYSVRRWLAAQLSARSSSGVITARINDTLAAAALKRHSCRRLVHGHLHRHGHYQWQDNGDAYSRWCLPAWEDAPGYAEICGGELRYVLMSAASETV